MNSSLKDNPEMLSDIFFASKKHIDCAAKLLKNLGEHEEPLCNFALYHLTVCFKIALRVACLRFSIEYTDNDSIEVLFNKTGQFLPAHILDMEKDICYWHNKVQYESKNVMTVDAACEIGRTIENYFNKHMRAYTEEMNKSVKESTLFSVSIKVLNKF